MLKDSPPDLAELRRREELLRDDLREVRREYLAERAIVVNAQHAAIQGVDKAMLTLAAAALGFSMSLMSFVKTQPPRIDLLLVSWLCFAVSVVSTVISMFLSHLAFKQELSIVDSEYKRARQLCLSNYQSAQDETTSDASSDDKSAPVRNWATIATMLANAGSMLFFVIGMICLIWFSHATLTQ